MIDPILVFSPGIHSKVSKSCVAMPQSCRRFWARSETSLSLFNLTAKARVFYAFFLSVGYLIFSIWFCLFQNWCNSQALVLCQSWWTHKTSPLVLVIQWNWYQRAQPINYQQSSTPSRWRAWLGTSQGHLMALTPFWHARCNCWKD